MPSNPRYRIAIFPVLGLILLALASLGTTATGPVHTLAIAPAVPVKLPTTTTSTSTTTTSTTTTSTTEPPTTEPPTTEPPTTARPPRTTAPPATDPPATEEAPEEAPAPVVEAYSSMEPCGGDLPPCYVKYRESHGDYTALNRSSGASGAWQFLDSTWAGYGGYSKAMYAPPSVQDQKARELWDGGNGCSHWAAC